MRPVTRKRITNVYLGLQAVMHASSGANYRRITAAMRLLDHINSDMRRTAVFEAGKKARRPIPRFEKRQLGSMESSTFYDGYEFTHPGFKNPYRGVR